MSTATAASIPAARAAAPERSLTPFPSPAALALEASSWRELEATFLRGATPDVDALVGWEFRGINHPKWARLAGIKKFVKGFYRTEDGKVMGYNSPVAQNVLDGRWHVAPKKFGFYEVHAVDATDRDNAYLHSVLLNYGRGGNKPYDPTRNLRDYLVQVDPGNPDLFLGKAYYAIGPVRLPTNFFILERHRVGLTDYAKR